MGNAQILLVLGALILIGTLSLQISRSISTRQDWDLYNQSVITGTGLAQSLIEEIRSKAFDEKTVSASVLVPDSLTSPYSLGPETGETSLNKYDDVDDYNGYTRRDSMAVLGAFNSKVRVRYITKMDPETYSSTPTFSKRIDLVMANQFLTDSLRLSLVVTY